MSKLIGRPSMFHKIAILSIVTGDFSHINHVSIDTFSHEQLYSVYTEARKPVVKHFQHQSRRTMSEEIAPVSPKNTYLRSRTWQPTHQTCLPSEQVLHILGQYDMVWCGILAPKPFRTLSVVLQGGKEAAFSAPNSEYCWPD